MGRFQRPSDRALRLADEHGVVDLHADTLLWVRFADYDIARRHKNRLPMAPAAWHVDLPRLREGRVRVQFFGVVTLPWFGERGCAGAALDSARLLQRDAARLPRELTILRTRGDLARALEGGTIGGLLALEGAHALEGDMENLEALYLAGLRSLGLAHFSSNSAAPCAYGYKASNTEKLSAFGRKVVDFCDEKGLLVDLAHLGRAAFLETCQGATRPRIVSHTGLSGVFPHWRNIDDEQLRAVAETGGVVGVIFAPRFLGKNSARAVAAHIAHGISVAGEDTLALGSDFDGFIVPVSELPGADAYPRLIDALLEVGLSETAIAKVLSQNALRVLREVLPEESA